MRQINPHIFLEECVNNIRSEYMALLELHPGCKVVIRDDIRNAVTALRNVSYRVPKESHFFLGI